MIGRACPHSSEAPALPVDPAEGPWLESTAHAIRMFIMASQACGQCCHARMHVHMAVFLLLDACMGHGVDEAAGSCGLADGLRPCGAWLGGLSM